MMKKQLLLVIAALVLLGIVGGIVFKMFAKVPEIENTPIGTSSGFWAEDPMTKISSGLFGKNSTW